MVLAGVGCKRKNPAVCCTSPADCDSIGIRETESLCDPGFVCIDHECTTAPDAPPAPPCETADDCSSTAPYCSLDKTCVECLTDEHCADATPVCDRTMHECRGCERDDECASGVCNLSSGSCVAEASVLYAAPSGSGATTCTRTEPCSITRAIELADPARYVVKMLPGTYTANLMIDGKRVDVHGHGATLNAAAGANLIEVYNGAHLRMSGVALVNINTPNNGAGVYCRRSGGTTPTIELEQVSIDAAEQTLFAYPCTVTMSRSQLRTRLTSRNIVLVLPTSSVTIDRSVLDGGRGVQAEGTDSVVRITNSILKNQTGDIGAFAGTNTFDAGAGAVTVSFSTVINAEVKCGSGVPRCAGGTAAGSCIENTIIYNALPNAPTDTVQPGGCTASYSLIYPQSSPVPGNENKFGVNPQFADFAAGDYHLTSTSSAIDAADPGANNMVDFDGTSRPQGTRSDIGAFEYKP